MIHSLFSKNYLQENIDKLPDEIIVYTIVRTATDSHGRIIYIDMRKDKCIIENSINEIDNTFQQYEIIGILSDGSELKYKAGFHAFMDYNDAFLYKKEMYDHYLYVNKYLSKSCKFPYNKRLDIIPCVVRKEWITNMGHALNYLSSKVMIVSDKIEYPELPVASLLNKNHKSLLKYIEQEKLRLDWLYQTKFTFFGNIKIPPDKD